VAPASKVSLRTPREESYVTFAVVGQIDIFFGHLGGARKIKKILTCASHRSGIASSGAFVATTTVCGGVFCWYSSASSSCIPSPATSQLSTFREGPQLSLGNNPSLYERV
jgi:hypothetical protein